jgi:nicotinamidase/pyrazinamidase
MLTRRPLLAASLAAPIIAALSGRALAQGTPQQAAPHTGAAGDGASAQTSPSQKDLDMLRPTDVLLAIDLQNDFMPGGSLAVAHGDEVMPIVNRLAQAFENVVLTQDWHPANHISFAANHPGHKPFESITLPYGEQTLWPVHCVQGSIGAALHTGLETTIKRARAIVRKGWHPAVDSYSAFMEADRKTKTGLAGFLHELGIERVYCCGLATDFCVAWSALDARAAGFEVALIEDASRAIDLNGSLNAAWQQLRAAGVARVSSADVLRG